MTISSSTMKVMSRRIVVVMKIERDNILRVYTGLTTAFGCDVDVRVTMLLICSRALSECIWLGSVSGTSGEQVSKATDIRAGSEFRAKYRAELDVTGSVVVTAVLLVKVRIDKTELQLYHLTLQSSKSTLTRTSAVE